MDQGAQDPAAGSALGRASRGKLAMLYDGACDMCVAGVTAVRRFDNSGRIEALDLHDPVARAQFPDLKLEALIEELHAVDDRGRVYRGARAVNEVLRRQPGLTGYLAYLWYLPGFALIARWQYRRIAATRYQRDARGILKRPAAGSE